MPTKWLAEWALSEGRINPNSYCHGWCWRREPTHDNQTCGRDFSRHSDPHVSEQKGPRKYRVPTFTASSSARAPLLHPVPNFY